MIIDINEIYEKCCEFYGVDPVKAKGKSRVHDYVMARQVFAYLCHRKYGFKLYDIANFFGKHEHTTQLHSINKIESEYKLGYEDVVKLIDEIVKSISFEVAIDWEKEYNKMLRKYDNLLHEHLQLKKNFEKYS